MADQVELTDDEGRRVRLLEPLGKGGFGSVWLAEVESTGGLVHRMAVKLLHEELMTDDELVARARDEARLMSQLNHDHVVKVHALTRLGGRSAVLMEYVEGIDCTALLADCRQRGEPGLPLGIALAITERAASALHAAWTARSPQTGRPLKVVHRDIKPSNLLVSVSGAVKVMDFGVARAEFDREARTESVQFGTQRYMAPERWLESRAGPESDVFSLGVTLWELAAGTRFERLPLQPDHFEQKRAHQLADLERHTPADPRVLRELQDLLRGMLAFESSERPGAGEVEERAGSILERARGPEPRRWARARVPQLVAARGEALGQDAELAALSGTLSQRVTPELTEVTAAETEQDAPPSRLPVYAGMGAALLAVLGLGSFGIWTLWPPAPEEAPVAEEAPIAEEAEPEEAVEPPPAAVELAPEAAIEAPKRSAPRPAVAEPEPELEPEVEEPEPVAAIEPPAAVETTWIKITADPRDGGVTRDGASIPTFQEVEYEVGSTVRLVYTWPDAQTVVCTKQITSDIRRIKFDKARLECTSS